MEVDVRAALEQVLGAKLEGAPRTVLQTQPDRCRAVLDCVVVVGHQTSGVGRRELEQAGKRRPGA